MLKKATYKGKLKPGGFKGFPLIDFLHPNALKAEGILSHPVLINALTNHIRGFAAGSTIGATVGGSSPESSPIRVNGPGDIAIGGRDRVVDASQPKPTFEEMFTGFLEGLYLGNFTSHVVQPSPKRPPLQYIYEIGVNTDKDTGFIVNNPFDTLVTFGPRDPKYPYGENEHIPARIAKLPSLRFASKVSEDKCDEKIKNRYGNIKDHTTISDPVKAVRTDWEKRNARVCDLNLRVIVNGRNQLQSLSIYGDTLKLHLSKGLLQTAERTDAGKWVKTGKRLTVPLGNRIISLKKNRLPNWGGAIDLQGAAVSITSSGLMGRLNKVNIGGTLEKPLLVFDKVEILK